MDVELLAVGSSALVGIAGIAATFTLARGQRKADAERLRNEARSRYRFDAHERRATLYSEYLATLESVVTELRIQNGLDVSFRANWPVGLAEKVRRDAEQEGDSPLGGQLRAFASALDADPSLAVRMAGERPDLGPRFEVDVVATIRQLAAAEAKISVFATKEMSRAAADARAVATAALMRFAANQLAETLEDLDTPLKSLSSAIEKVRLAALYELRLLPFGEASSLEELIEAAEAGAPPSHGTP